MPVVDLRDVSVLEENSSWRYITFTVVAEAVATVPITVDYYVQSGSAADQTGDINETASSVTIPIGADRATIQVQVFGDTLIEGNETFEVVVFAGQNAELAGGAAALSATGTIYDNDDALSDPVPGEGAPAERLYGPVAEPGVFPTLDVRDVSVIEGNSSWEYARFLVTLDRPATASVTAYYYLEGVSASETGSDFNNTFGQVTIPAGEQTAYINAQVYGDTVIEPNETFELVIYDVSNAVLPGGAAALRASGTILDDDGGAPAAGGIGDFADRTDGADPASATLPTIRIHDGSLTEGNSSWEYMNFFVTLDQPADTAVSFVYSVTGGTASGAALDYALSPSTFTFQPGEQSGYIRAQVWGDVEIEGDETFFLTATDISGAVFENDAAALVATGTIRDNDSGAISGTNGLGDVGFGISGPVPRDGIALDVVDISVIEGNSGFHYAEIYVLLSEPAPATISVRYETIEGSALNSDFFSTSGTLQFQAGEMSSRVRIGVVGDNLIEGDEEFTVQFSQPSGAEFANGETTLNATVLIRDNDDASTTGQDQTGPDFGALVITPTPGASPGNDILGGGAGADNIRALSGNDRISGGGGNDTIYGGGGADFIDGGTGADIMVGGTGNDFYIVDNPGDTVTGEIAFSLGGGIDTVRTFIDNFVQPDNIELVRIGNITDTANHSATGNDAPGTLVGNAGNNTLTGRGGNDQLNGNGGNDVIIGNTGRDTLVGGAGSDTFVYLAYADSRAGSLNRDVINGFDRLAGADDVIDLSAMDANTTTFGVDDAFVFIGARAFSGTAGELRTQGLGGANAVIVEADHNGDGAADFQIFVNLTTFMTGSDFIL